MHTNQSIRQLPHESTFREERILAITEPMRYWPQKRPRQFKFGSFLGRIVVTERHLVFLSTGGAGWDESIIRLAAGGFVGLLLNLTTAGHTTKDLDLSAMRNEGSFAVRLGEILSCEAQRSFFLAFMTMRYKTDQGEGWCALVREAVAGLKDLQELERMIEEAKASSDRG